MRVRNPLRTVLILRKYCTKQLRATYIYVTWHGNVYICDKIVREYEYASLYEKRRCHVEYMDKYLNKYICDQIVREYEYASLSNYSSLYKLL